MENRKNLNPLSYEIHLNIDLHSDNFEGYATALLEIRRESAKIVLNIDELEVQNCMLLNEKKEIPCSFEEHQEKKELLVQLPEKLKGQVNLKVNYKGKYHSDLLGMYKSKYEYKGKEECMISTQLEEIYARRVFPCVDHPSKKAQFKIELIIDKDLNAISNTAIEQREALGNGRERVSFKCTPKMCTYLLYIGVGNLEIKEKKDSHLVRIIATPGKAKYGDLALDIALKSLKYCETFTSQKYPLQKCDLIAVPDFPFGAMENWGAITFRENMLLVYPDKTSQLGIFNIASVVAHEISHFWFGNLVSPMDWKYIWLNESFASYFTYVIPHNYHPDWHSWEHFVVQYYDSSLERDGLINTYPVELEDEEGAFITPAKVGIVYNKGATILRMMIDYLGQENFKRGVSEFMEEFKYANAVSKDYWDGLERGSGEPIKSFADSWVHQSGYPIISVKAEVAHLKVEQEHFTYLPQETDKLWFIPVRVKIFKKDGKSKQISFNFSSKTHKVGITENYEAIKVNIKQRGFYRVIYQESMLENLGRLISRQILNPIDRYGIENDLFALVKKGKRDLSYYLSYLESYYLNERDYLPLVSIFSHLKYIWLLRDSEKSKVKEIGGQIIGRFFRKQGTEPKEGEEMRTSILRNHLLWFGSLFEMENISQFCKEKFEILLKGDTIVPDILPSVLQVGAMKHPRAKSYFLRKIQSADTPQVEKAYIYGALGCFQDGAQIQEALNIMLKIVPPQSWLYTLRRAGTNRGALDLLWPWFKDNLKTLESKSPFVLARIVASIIPLGGLAFREEIETFLNKYKEKHEFHKGTINMSLERLKINSKFSKNR